MKNVSKRPGQLNASARAAAQAPRPNTPYPGDAKTVGHTNNTCLAHRVCDLADLAQMVNQSERFAKPSLCIFRLPQPKKLREPCTLALHEGRVFVVVFFFFCQ